MENSKRFNTNIFADGELAQKIGVTESIVFSKIKFWVDKNTKENKNFIDGKYWVYNSIKDWQQNHLPFYAIGTLTKVINKLEKIGILESKNLNSRKFDKTKWYTVNYIKLKEILQDDSSKEVSNENEYEEIESNNSCSKLDKTSCYKIESPSLQNSKPIPVINTEILSESISSNSSILQQDTKLDKSNTNSLTDIFQSNICELKKTTLAKFNTLTQKLNFSLIKEVIEQCAISCVRSYKGFEVALQSYLDRNCTNGEEVKVAAEKFREKRRQAIMAKKMTNNKQYSNSNNYYKKTKDSFCNYPQRDYNFVALERKLLGWDTIDDYSFDNTVDTSVESDIQAFLNASYA